MRTLLINRLLSDLLLTYVLYCTTQSQNSNSKSASFSITLASILAYYILRSVILFQYKPVYVVVSSSQTLFFDYLSSSSLISTTLSDLTMHRLCRVLCSLVTFYLQSCIIRPDFVLSTNNYVFLIILSTTYAKYLFLRIVSRNRLAISTKTRARIASFYKNRTLLI